MGNALVNQALEAAAKRTLTHLTGSEDTIIPMYLQPDRAIFLAEHFPIIFKVYAAGQALQYEYAITQKAAGMGIPIPEILGFEAGPPAVLAMKQILGRPLSSHTPYAAKEAGTYLQSFHNIGAHPPFSGGQQQWDDFIIWWVNEEKRKVEGSGVFDPHQLCQLQEEFETLRPLIVHRPIVLLHGDLQAEHILVDPQTEQVLAFLDFADAQPGDPLLDIAVLTLWDHDLTGFLLEGYCGIANLEETQRLLARYRLLRHLAEIPWLLERGFAASAKRNIAALEDFLRASLSNKW